MNRYRLFVFQLSEERRERETRTTKQDKTKRWKQDDRFKRIQGAEDAGRVWGQLQPLDDKLIERIHRYGFVRGTRTA